MIDNNKTAKMRRYSISWLLMFYDVCIYALVCVLLLVLYKGNEEISPIGLACHSILFFIAVFGMRIVLNVYRQIWRYGGIQSYIKLLLADSCAFVIYFAFRYIIPEQIYIVRALSICCMNLLVTLAIRMVYRYAYKYVNDDTFLIKLLCKLIYMFGGRDIKECIKNDTKKIKVAIVGAGRVGVALAEELTNNSNAYYTPRCFVDVNKEKIGKQIYGIPVLSESEASLETLKEYGIQEVVFALPQMDSEEKKKLYEYYRKSGCKIKAYDYPIIQTAGNGKRYLREFDIEELLFRKPLTVADEQTDAYYRGKRVLITGGGGSIGSELCRQIAKMKPQQLIILDVYENGAYDVQQELKMAYGDKLDLRVEIVSVCNKVGLERVFAEYRPQIVLNAAAHKHVPLMERNCIEAVENNVFGTLNTVELSEKYGVERFIMISTDKAVNPTNVMGATKRMCEMIVQAHSMSDTETTFSATRFGNVLGSAGSVIPLFKRQIASGGPVTLTDKRIIRYFMTIPEASQLVLQSGAMAKNGELFVLDMGKPIKILELAENMIRLSGMEPYKDIQIVETGLRPGEKLYEELLVKTEKLDQTSNNMIFVERDTPLSIGEIEEKLLVLKAAINSGSDDAVREALMRVVPTFKKPEEVNATADEAQEMKEVCFA